MHWFHFRTNKLKLGLKNILSISSCLQRLFCLFLHAKGDFKLIFFLQEREVFILSIVKGVRKSALLFHLPLFQEIIGGEII